MLKKGREGKGKGKGKGKEHRTKYYNGIIAYVK